MNNTLTKKVVIIFSVLLFVVLSAILLAFLTGNTRYPQLSDPDGVFFQRLDDDGNVLYTITNKELFEQIKGSDGIEQLLLMVDTYLLQDYLDEVTSDEIQAKIKELKYGTSDQDEIDQIDLDRLSEYEKAFTQSVTLAGYLGNEEAYARIIVAREKAVRVLIDENEEITDLLVANEYANKYFEDIQAIRIRFMSSSDATAAMKKFGLLVYNLTDLREYNGYTFKDETLKNGDVVVEAYQTVFPYYFDEDNNIVDLEDEVIYSLGTNDIYTNEDDVEFSIDESGNLVNVALEVIIPHEELFNAKADAVTYKENNTTYYTVTKTDAFDLDENAQVLDSEDVVQFYVDKTGKVYDSLMNDITTTTDLIVNKVYKSITSVSTATVNNSSELTESEILQKYIQMYNYVYEDQRDLLPEDATVEELIALESEYLSFNFEDVRSVQSSLATYMFKTLDLSKETVKPYSVSPKKYNGSQDNNHYLVFKLSQVDKVDVLEMMLDKIEENIKLPAQTAKDIALPTTGWYGATIAWTSGNTDVVSNAGIVTKPAEDTDVVLTYKITANTITRTGTITVKVLRTGETSEVTPTEGEEVTFKSMLNDDVLYDTLYNKLVDETLNSVSSEIGKNQRLANLRMDYGIEINDYYLALDYSKIDSDFEINKKGDKVVLASVTGRPGAEEAAYEITADDFYEYTLSKNAALYTLYASQYKELVASEYFLEIFGEETQFEKNKTLAMQEMFDSVQNAKDYYAYLQQLYASYGVQFTFNSFQEYAYSQYSTKTEADLVKFFIQGKLQPYFINEAITDYELVNLVYPTILEFYQNYFSLNVTHILTYVDFDENGKPDDYQDFIASLTEAEKDEFDTLRASFETALDEYLEIEDNTFTTFVTAYQNASRDDITWGVFKQYGLQVLTEDLNIVDEDDVSHSLQYSGEYGVKDSFVPEYVDALIKMYEAFQSEVNQDATELYSSDENIPVETEFGIHLILVTKGDDFDQPTTNFEEANPANPIYSEGSENEQDEPTLEQLLLYAEYFFYSTVYDLEDADIESKYEITVPNIPARVSDALDFYFSQTLQSFYVVGTVNIQLVDRLSDSEFVTTDYLAKTNAELMTMLQDVQDVYMDALYGQYQD